MAWTIRWEERALKDLRKLGHVAADMVTIYMDNRVAKTDNPKQLGQALVGNKKGLWRYRVGDYRVLCRIIDDALIVLVITVGHRKEVYTIH